MLLSGLFSTTSLSDWSLTRTEILAIMYAVSSFFSFMQINALLRCRVPVWRVTGLESV